MLINISELLSTTSKSETFRLEIGFPSFKLDGMSYDFLEKQPVILTIANAGERVLHIEGTIDAVLDIPCSRCLTSVPTPFHISIDRNVDLSQKDVSDADESDETSYFEGSDLDADRLVYNEILVEFPPKTLCSEDCKGLCPVCGKDLNKGECGCDRTPQDPRMAAIRDIFNNFKEV